MKNKRVLLIYQNEKFPYAFDSAYDNNLDVILIHKPNEPYTQCYRGVIHVEAIDIFSDSMIALEYLVELVKEFEVEVIITYRDEAIPFTSLLAENVGIPYVSTGNADSLRDKSKMRELTANLESTPKSKSISSIEDLTSSDINYPYILKPSSGFGSMGVTLVSSNRNISDAYHLISDINTNTLCNFKNSSGTNIASILQEQYIPGEEFIVDSFSIDGEHKILSIASKGESKGPYFEESYHITNPDIYKKTLEGIIKATLDTLDSIEFKNGPTHTELKVYKERAYIIEIGARIGGGSICHYLVNEGTGVDYSRLVFDLCMSDRSYFDTISDTPIYRKCALNYNIKVGKQGGKFVRIKYLKNISLDSRVRRILRVMNKGHLVKPYPKFTGFPGFIQSSHHDYNDALKFIKKLDSELIVEYI
ncbi:MAG: ATP-grasp domain-containing protein [Ectothiorhodospiraceae bacterium]|nr:ATP-grasp domain-containing protein [Ectothiorhodospiraceae bacterium]